MKKILLRETGVRAEMRRGKMTQAFFAGATSWKIKSLQRAFNPDINRKRGIKTVAEKQNAVGYLAADAAKFHQFRARFGIIQFADFFQIEFAAGDLPRGGEEVWRTKAHFTISQLDFSRACNFFRRWKCKL